MDHPRPLLIVSCLTTLALQPSALAERYPIYGFEALRGMIVLDVFQDSSGYIWLATGEGLLRGQAGRFETIDCPRRDGEDFPMPARWGVGARSLIEDSRGVLWIGTYAGLIALDLATLEPRPAPPRLEHKPIHDLYRDRRGRLWVAARQGLYRVETDGASPRAVIAQGTESDCVYSIAAGTRDDLWLGARGALLHVTEGRVERLYEHLIGDGPVTLLRTSDGALWVGLRHDGGLYRLVDDRLERLTEEHGLGNEDVNALAEDRHGEVWVGTEDGVYLWADGRFIAVDRARGLENTDVHSLFFDAEDQTWIGTFGGGAYCMPSRHVRIYDVGDGLPHPMVLALSRAPDGGLMVGTVAGVCRFDTARSSFEALTTPHPVYRMCVDGVGNAWIADACRVRRVRDGLEFTIPEGVDALGCDGGGRLLIGARERLYAVDGESLRSQALPIDPSAAVRAILAERNGAVLLGTSEGLFERSGDRWRPVLQPCDITALARSPDGTIWIGAGAEVLAVRDVGSSPSVARAIRVGRVRDLACDRDGTVWIATDNGLRRLRDGKLDGFTTVDGLPSRDVRAVLVGDRDRVYAGTTQWLAVLDPTRLEPCKAAPRIVIRDWSVGESFGRVRHGTPTVPTSKDDVLVRVQPLGRRSSVDLQYSYMLEGRDDRWSPWTDEAVRHFTNLAPGEYTLKVKGRNTWGIESDSPARLTFRLPVPYWRQPWFLALAGGVGGLLGLTTYLAHARKTRLLAERMRAERALRDDESKFRTLAETTAAATFIFRGARLCYTNTAAQRMTGYSEAELSAMNFWDVIHPDDQELVRDRGMRRQRNEDVPAHYELKILTRHGETRWVDFTGRLIHYRGDPAVLGTAFDTTERKRAVERDHRHQTALAHVSRLSIMGQMAAELAHELNQPLSAIISYAGGCLRRLRSRGDAAPDLCDACERITAQATRAGDIIRRVRSFASRTEPRREAVDINRIVREAAQFVAIDAERRRIHVRLDLADHPPPARADAIQIEQVIVNLMLNGLEATTGHDGEVAELLVRTAALDSGEVQVSVQDQGRGLEPEVRDQIFDPFFTTKRHGLGMGLSISRAITARHGGRLWATDNPNSGTTFHFTLPSAAAETPDAAPSRRSPE